MRPVFVVEELSDFFLAAHADLFRYSFPNSLSFGETPALGTGTAEVILQVLGQVNVIQMACEGIDNVSGNP